MKKSIKFSLATVGGLLITGTTVADVQLFDISRDGRGAWEEALANNGLNICSTYDLTSQFGDPGIVGIDGPIGIGNGGITADSNMNPFGEGGQAGRGAGGSGLVLVGASAGFGNNGTSLLANYFVDSFDMNVISDYTNAVDFDATSLLGSNTVTFSVYGIDGGLMGQFAGLDAGAVGHSYGVLSDAVIGYINIYDEVGGVEGITGRGATYWTPAPGALPLLVAAGFIGHRRRRNME